MYQLRSFPSLVCSTQYNVSGTSQGYPLSNCEDPRDLEPCDKSVQSAPQVKVSTGGTFDLAGYWHRLSILGFLMRIL
jgi:hypothetical protein